MPPGPGVFPGRRDAAVWCIQVNKASCLQCQRRRSVASIFEASCRCQRLARAKHNLACWGRPAFVVRVGMDSFPSVPISPRAWAPLGAAEEQDFISGGGGIGRRCTQQFLWSWDISGAEKRRFFVCSHTRTPDTRMTARATQKDARFGSLSGKMCA